MRKGYLVFAVLAGLLCTEAALAKSKKPNILFILSDDQGYGDLARHGHPYLHTPNLDQLHDDSVRFDNFYVSPSCSPTRAALMTGMHEFRNGVTHTLQPREHLYKEATLLPALLKTAGYTTGFIGKWHLSEKPGYGPDERGFDWCATNVGGPRQHFDVDMIRNHKRHKTTGFREDAFFDEAMTFIDEAGDNPFFLYLCTYSPHTPLDAPAELVEKYKKAGLNDKHSTYLAMIENIDQNIGRLNAFLKERGLEEDTIIMFINDNGVTEGLDVYNAGMRGCKCTAWEGGTRAMSFWKWPGQWKPKALNNLTAHLDVLPTLCDIADVKIPKDLESELQGYSLLPLLKGKSWKHDERTLFHNVGRWPSGTAAAHKYAMCSVRKGNMLLVRSGECGDAECAKYQSQCSTMRAVRAGKTRTTYTAKNAQYHWGVTPQDQWMLFDVKKDPGCNTDVSDANPELVKELIKSYDAWWDEQFPLMMERGGDAGDPTAASTASSRVRHNAAKKVAVKRPVKKTVGPSKASLSRLKRLDRDGDQKVSCAEYCDTLAEIFNIKDIDNNALLTEVEFPYTSFFKVGDMNGDHMLSDDEFNTISLLQFDSRDKNQDGDITIEEL